MPSEITEKRCRSTSYGIQGLKIQQKAREKKKTIYFTAQIELPPELKTYVKFMNSVSITMFISRMELGTPA
jgi:hypothetical protein